MKTAELFALSCELSAYLSNANPEQRSALRQFGMGFGTAYQIYDDCLDLFGTESSAGKSLGTDLQQGKLTLPVLLAFERADEPDHAALQEMIRDWNPSSMMRLTGLFKKYDCLKGSLASLQFYLETARQSLLTLPNSVGRASLFGLTEYLAGQTDSLTNKTAGGF
jgi:octaprenyl-diphosphate synthase